MDTSSRSLRLLASDHFMAYGSPGGRFELQAPFPLDEMHRSMDTASGRILPYPPIETSAREGRGSDELRPGPGHQSGALIPHRRGRPGIQGTLLARPNRFLGLVRLGDGREVEAHIADRGRLEGILFEGAEVRLTPATGPKRRTAYTLLLARSEGIWVCIDPAGANHLVRRLLETRALPLPAYRGIHQEVPHGSSRFDFALEIDGEARLLLEVKSAGVARDGVALFPDAPSLRAARHCRELAALSRAGEKTAIVLVAQRGDAGAISPHPVDPDFSLALREAAAAGVSLLGVAFSVEVEGFRYLGPVPILL